MYGSGVGIGTQTTIQEVRLTHGDPMRGLFEGIEVEVGTTLLSTVVLHTVAATTPKAGTFIVDSD